TMKVHSDTTAPDKEPMNPIRRIQLERKPYQEKKEERDSAAQLTETIINDIFGKNCSHYYDIFEPGRKKREAAGTRVTTGPPKPSVKDEDYYAYEDSDYDVTITNASLHSKHKMDPKELMCLEYGESLLKWMSANRDRWGEFLTQKEMPRDPDYDEVMTGGCKGFGKTIMEWPEDLIIGGIKRSSGKLSSAEALQSVFLVASPFDVFIRFKEKKETHPNLDVNTWNPGWASDVVFGWQRNFTKRLYSHEANKNTEERVFHPLASTSIADMLEEFSQFNYTIIILGYVLMVIYAAFTQARIDGRWLAIRSNVALSFVGVILVTYASICGLGLSTAIGINFNAATTQIVPFLSLGLGIDDMFLLLHNYDEISHTMRKNEMGILLKETGMSVMVTSINNILAFCAGYVLPIPALRSFCSQTAVLLAFNLASLMFVFPAFIGLDLRRVRAGKRDLVYCGPSDPNFETSEKSSAELSTNADLTNPTYIEAYTRDQPWYTVGGFLTNLYIPLLKMKIVKAAVIFTTLCGVAFGLYGMYTTTLGLELADVLPENTAPAAFMRAREKYFSFYPMYAVLRGRTIDIPNKQPLIEEYREALGATSFIVKANGKLQPYWMSMLRVWLESLQIAFEKDIANGLMDPVTGAPIKGKMKPAPESMIARRLICSYGRTYNCTGRVGHIKMVENGIIRPESFYNYLTAWYNIDNMMYYVSQASFQPTPPFWQMGPVSATSFIVKANGKLQPYWMSMLRVWLESLQIAFEKDIANGLMDPVTGAPIKGKMKPAPESMIARRLICSYGRTYNCTGRVGHIKMVENGIIRPESFYNYLTAWYNIDNMMYYVSQASFQPTPPFWQMGPHEGVVPPARPLLYSQIPFYQTNLTDTPVTVTMIQ
ncbi:patched family protein, partial [Teladorsagia circumcincta]